MARLNKKLVFWGSMAIGFMAVLSIFGSSRAKVERNLKAKADLIDWANRSTR